MKKKFSKGSPEFEFFQEYWGFIQEYAIPEKNDEYWDSLMTSADTICKKHNQNKFVQALVFAFANAVENKETD